MTYKEQYQVIEKVTKSIRKKSKHFVKTFDKVDTPYYEDLLAVIKDLKEVDDFLK